MRSGQRQQADRDRQQHADAPATTSCRCRPRWPESRSAATQPAPRRPAPGPALADEGGFEPVRLPGAAEQLDQEDGHHVRWQPREPSRTAACRLGATRRRQAGGQCRPGAEHGREVLAAAGSPSSRGQPTANTSAAHAHPDRDGSARRRDRLAGSDDQGTVRRPGRSLQRSTFSPSHPALSARGGASSRSSPGFRRYDARPTVRRSLPTILGPIPETQPRVVRRNPPIEEVSCRPAFCF